MSLENPQSTVWGAVKILNNSKPSVSMYLLQKTHSKSYEKMFELFSADIVDQVPHAFRELASNWLTPFVGKIKTEEVRIRDFFRPDGKGPNIFLATPDSVPSFGPILNKIKQKVNLAPSTDISPQSIWAYAIEFSTSSGRLVYFRKYSKSKVLVGAMGLVLSFQNGRFTHVEGDVLAFDTKIDCLYFEAENILMIFNRKNFESVFNFMEFYKQQTVGVFEKLVTEEKVEVKEGLIEAASTKRRLARKVTNLEKHGVFKNLVVSDLKKSVEVLSGVVSFKIENGKVILEDQKSLDDFVDVCNKNFLKDITSEDIYRTSNKELVKKAQKVPVTARTKK